MKTLKKGTIITIEGIEEDSAGRHIRDGICIKTGKKTPYPTRLIQYKIRAQNDRITS